MATNEHTVEDVVEVLKSAKDRGKGATLLVGAGVSFRAGGSPGVRFCRDDQEGAPTGLRAGGRAQGLPAGDGRVDQGRAARIDRTEG